MIKKQLVSHSLFEIVLLALLVAFLPSLKAQTVINGSTVTTNAVYYVGDTTAGNTLVISNNGRLFVTNDILVISSTIGNDVASSNNTALVTGSGSMWTNSGELFVGYNGASNMLTISNGGRVDNNLGGIGGALTSSSNNVVLVTGAGSLWTNRSSLIVGFSGAGNQMIVSDGGTVVNGFGYVGQNNQSSNNVVLVTGAGSLWTNRSDLFVGFNGQGNTLIISNGASVIGASNLTLGGAFSSINNMMNLSGAASTLVVTNAGGTGTNEIRRGTFTQNGGTFRTDNLLVTNAAGSYAFNSGTAIVQNTSISNGANFVIGGTDGTGGGAVYVAHTGVHSLSNNLIAGSNTAANTLIITNGARVENNFGIIGNTGSSSNNVVSVTGAGSLWTNRSDLFVGFQGAANSLTISNGASVNNFDGQIGVFTSSSNNVVTVTGAGSLWTNRSDLYVGNDGAGNQMIVSNGGTVVNQIGYIGFNSSSSNNTVLVTGTGSQWTNRSDLRVGSSGQGNTLTISDGGRVENSIGYIGLNATSSNNTVTVTGANSLWTNRGALRVGNNGAGNTLTISNGGRVENSFGYVGTFVSSSNNVVTVTGTDSLWTNRDELFVGNSGAGNQMVISNGGKVTANSLTMGVNASSTNNAISMSGAASQLVVTNAGGTGTTDIRRGTFTQNGGTFRTDNLLVTNAAGSYAFNSGTAIVQNASISNGVNFVIGGTDGTGGGAVYVAHTGTHNLQTNLFVGSNTVGNTLLVSNGGTVANQNGNIGVLASSSNNIVQVTGTGSLWTNRGQLRVGDAGAGNQMIVSSGGTVFNGDGLVGTFASSSNNVVQVTGTGSLWTNQNDLYVGWNGASNQMIVSNGGTVVNADGLMGAFASSSNNIVQVTGAGSLWTNRSTLVVGNFGAGNQMIVSNGGRVENNIGYIGFNASSSNNIVQVTGTGSVWTNRADLTVGYTGRGNSLTVENGGMVYATNLNIGFFTGSSNNSVVVRGNNSQITVGGGGANDNVLRLYGTGDTLIISNGGAVVTGTGVLGNNDYSSNTVVTVTGTDSLFSNRGDLYVGLNGRQATLNIENGGKVTASNLTMGLNALSPNNAISMSGGASQLVVTNASGTGTSDIRRGIFTQNGGTFRTDNLLLTNASGNYLFNGGTAIVQNASMSNGAIFVIGGTDGTGGGAVYVAHTGTHNVRDDLIVGSNTVGNSLIVSNGGSVQNAAAYLGFQPAGSNNNVLVTGSGSQWTNRGDLRIGNTSVGNTLTISNGGRVDNGFGIISDNVSSSNNVVTVTGADSLWSNRNHLTVGGNGVGNRLTISNGGRVDSDFAIIGSTVSSSNNTVSVSGTGSLWSNRSGLIVGSSGLGNSLTISDNGRVENDIGYIGFNASSSNNVVLVTGPGSLWTNRSNFIVGRLGAHNSLTISNGGRVENATGTIGQSTTASNNVVTVTGANSVWNHLAELQVGFFAAGNALHIADSGAVFASNLTMGVNASSSNNIMNLSGAASQLLVTNAGGTGTSDIRRGTFTQNGGTFRTDNLLLTNATGLYTFNGGTAIVQNATINNGAIFTVGNGTDAALFSGLAGGTNTFNNGVSVAAQGVLTADGTLTSGFIETLANGTVNVNGTLTGTTTLLTNNGTFNASNSFTVAGLEGTTGTLNLNGAGVTGIVSITGTSTYNGAIAGAGALTKEGTGVLNLGGNNTFTGPLNIINGGTVNANGGSAIGDTVAVSVAAGATLGLGASETIGSLEGAGNVTLGGNTLTAGGNDASTIFSGVMSGTGGYTKEGTGTNTLTGANLHTGDTTVNGGLLVLNGSVAGNVTVNAAGLLGGSGTIGGNLLNNGTINPGNSPGILNITGNFIQGAGGTLVIEVAGTTLGQFDRLNITGTATLDGTLQVVPFGGFAGFEDGQSITIITAAGGVTGTFANVIDTGALGFVVTYQANDVTVLVQGKPYDQNPNLTPNQKAIAEVLQQVRYSDDADWLQNIRPVLNGLSAEDLALAFSQMSPLFYQSMPQMNLSWMQSQFQNLRGRFDELRFGNQGGISTRNLSLFDARGERLVAGNSMMISDTGSPLYVPKASDWDKRVGMFLSGSGEFGGMDNQGALNGYDFTTAGVTLGIDYQFTPEIVVGAFGSYANSRTDEKRGLGKSDADSGRGGVYAGYFKKNTFLNVVAGVGYTAYETERPINIGPLSRTATASPEGQEAFTMIEAGHDFELGKLRLGPVGGFQYRYVNVDQFTESGAGALNLTVNQREMESIMSQLGVRASYELKLGRVILQPTVSARWQYEFGDTGKAVQARFGTLDSSVFNIQTTAPGRNSALVSAGLNAYLTETISVFGAYNLETDAADYTVHGVNAGFNWQF